MPFMIAADRDIYIPKGYFKSDKNMREVLKYEGDDTDYTIYCYHRSLHYNIIIYKGGSNYTDIINCPFNAVHIDEIIGSRSICEL